MSCKVSVRDVTWQDNELEVAIVATSDVPAHMWLRYTRKQPWVHKKPSLRRGVQFAEDVRFCFTVFQDIEQDEPGDTLTHTFEFQDWPVCETRWFYFWGMQGADVCNSTTALFEVHRQIKDVIEYVKSLGKHGEAEVLIDHVKLKEGENISITRDDVNNALIIASTEGDHFGFCDDYTVTKIPVDMLDKPVIRSDEILLSIHGQNYKMFVESLNMYTWETWQSLSLYFCARKADSGAANLRCFFGMNRGDKDIYNNWINNHIGVYLNNNRWYATNGDGANFVQTAIDNYSAEQPMPFKIVRSADDIKWYRNGVLKVTHNTYIPQWSWGFKEHYSAWQRGIYRSDIVCQHIKYFSGIFP